MANDSQYKNDFFISQQIFRRVTLPYLFENMAKGNLEVICSGLAFQHAWICSKTSISLTVLSKHVFIYRKKVKYIEILRN